jgi:hypothetical protein
MMVENLHVRAAGIGNWRCPQSAKLFEPVGRQVAWFDSKTGLKYLPQLHSNPIVIERYRVSRQ